MRGSFDDGEADVPRDHTDLPWCDLKPTKLRRDAQRAVLRDDQQVAVGVRKRSAVHGSAARVQEDGDALFSRRGIGSVVCMNGLRFMWDL